MKDISYKTFVNAVDQSCYARLGCSVFDLPDHPIRDSWDDLQEELAYTAPEDSEKRERLLNNYVSYLVDDLEMENLNDVNPCWL